MAEVVKSGRSSWGHVVKFTRGVLRVLFVMLPFVFVYMVATNRIVLSEPYRIIVLMSVVFMIGAVVVAFFMILMKVVMLLVFGDDGF